MAQPLSFSSTPPMVARETAARLRTSAPHEVARTFRRLIRSTMGASTRTPPRIQSIMKTIDVPSKV